MPGAIDKEYGVRCHICGGVFSGAGPSDEWGHNTRACARETVPRLHDRISLLESLLREAEIYCPRDAREGSEMLGNRIEIALGGKSDG